MKKFPPLLFTTNEGRRIYQVPFFIEINGVTIKELVIDPHFEQKHGSYMNDGKIYQIVQDLMIRKKRFVPAERKAQWTIFEVDVPFQGKNYRLVFCLEDEKNYLEIIHCYRKSKYDSES